MDQRLAAGLGGIRFAVKLSEAIATATDSSASLGMTKRDGILFVRHDFYVGQLDRLAVEIVFGRQI